MEASITPIPVAPPVLVQQQTKQRLKGQMTRDAVARLKLHEGLTLREIAQRLDMSLDGVVSAWKRVKREYGKGTLTESERDHMRAMIRAKIEATMETASHRVFENAAYGAVVLRCGETLIDLYDLKGSGPDGAKPSDLRERLKSLMERGRALSPLLNHRRNAESAPE
jgi:hypothetical protein